MPRGYVGRARECAELDDALDSLAMGQGGLLVVTGEAGVGKTRFLEEGALRARRRGVRVSWAAGWEGARERSLGVWSQLVEPLGEVLPVAGDPGAPEESRLRQLDLCVEQLRRLGGRGPLLLVVDDLQWADDSSLRLLHHASVALHAMPVLVVACARTPAGDRLRPLLRRSPSLALTGLSEDETRRLVHQVAGPAASGRQAGLVHEHTRGNPLFVRELARLLVTDGGPGDLEPGGWRLPDTVRAVVRERLGGVQRPVREVLRVVAAAGDEARVQVVAGVTGHDLETLTTMVDEARAAGLADLDPPRIVLAHPLFRTVLYDELGSARRVRLHEEIGRALVSAGRTGPPVRPAVLADHFLRSAPGGTAAEAVEHARAAATEAIGLASYDDAVVLLSRALGVADLDPAVDRGDLLVDVGRARWVAGDHEGARTALIEAASLGRARGRGDLVARAALGLAGPSGFEVPLFDREQVDLLEEALTALGDDEPELRALCAARLSVALSLTGAEPRRRELADEAVRLARRCGAPAALAQALAARCDADAGPATCAARLADAGEIADIGRRTGDRTVELLGRRHRVVALMELGDLLAVDAEIELFAKVAEPLAQARFDWYVALWRAARALHDRRLDDFERLRTKAADLAGRSGSPNAQVLVLAQRFFGAALTGRAAEAAAVVDEATADQGFALLGVQTAVTVALSHTLAGRLDQARIVLDAVADRLESEPQDSEWLPTMTQFLEAADAVGGHPACGWVRDRLAPYADRWVVEGIGAVIRGPVRHWLAPAAAPAGNACVREGEVWAVTFRGRTVRVRDTKGMRDLVRLLAQPGRDLAALDLMGAALVESDAGPALDETARHQYRRRLTEIEAELDEADRLQDAGTSDRLLAERAALLAELSAAYGLGGRARRAGGSAERARTAVTARLRDTIKRIAEAHPELGRHLARSVRTGTFCRYDPDPRETWTV